MEKEIDLLAQKVWSYLKMNQQIEKADCVLALGSHDIRVAKRAVDLFNQNLAPYIIFSGGFGRLTGDFPKPEAEVFADAALNAGIPSGKIIIENKSTNTGENIRFSIKLLKEKQLEPISFIIVTKPYMERRAFATFKKLLPGKKVVLTSPPMNFEDSAYGEFTKEDVINIMVGDLQRVKIYPGKGFQIAQDIPDDVWDAYNKLVALGYKKQLVSE